MKNNQNLYSKDNKSFINLAKDRFSVRKFQNKRLPKSIINKILESGHVAPTGCNYQPQRILVLNTKESIEKLKKCTRSHFDAPTAMLICYNKEETWTRKYDGAISAPIDASIVATHMVLMAHSIGVGSCIVMHFNPTSMKEEFNIPSNYEPLLLLVMGYADKDYKPLKLHDEYRPLSDVVYYDTF